MVSNSPAVPMALKVLAAVVFGLGVLMLAVYFLHFPHVFSSDQAVWGQFGDYVGGILNPLLSVPAFFAILYTIKLQADTVKMQAKQIREASEAAGLQALHSETTLFDTRLFQLIDMHQKVLSAIAIYPFRVIFPGDPVVPSEPWVGDRAIGRLWNGLLEGRLHKISRGDVNEDDYIAIQQEFDEWRADNWKHVGKYIKNLSNLLSYIGFAQGYADKWVFATDVVRANLSQDEQNLIFYFLVFSKELDRHASVLVSGRLMTEVDSRDPFLAHRPDFLHRKMQSLATKDPKKGEVAE